jgi:hypothetical protein
MTNFLEAVRWDLLGGGFQIALCAAILFAWVRRRIKRRAEAQAEPGAVSPMFTQEVFLQTIRQQAEHAFQNILAAVEVERDRLQHAWDGVGGTSASTRADTGASADALVAFRWGDPDPDGTGRSRYVGLEAFLEQGLSSRQIADRMNLPAGEIELALKLRDASQEKSSSEVIRQ